MAILLGIDTGGTYTDAVLLDEAAGVVNAAKALTTKQGLTLGIRQALEAVLPPELPQIKLVSLSTTLATNAIVEGRRSPVCLLLVGYGPETLERAGLRQALGRDPVIFIEGGHTESGKEKMPLDLEAARQAILSQAPKVAAFAVSAYFSVRNPAHEIAVRNLIRELTGLPVTCGHELTSHLDAPRRALTTLLNARLIPLLHGLILAVRAILAEKGIEAPLMVVKGDGSLIEAGVALERPIETILSGPAASVVGAHYLSGETEVMVADMGGTTTDIALLKDGRPVLNQTGARVGGWQTMVEAIAIHTIGLGGDSEVSWQPGEDLIIGPQRIVPLSLLAHNHPEVLDLLRSQLARDPAQPLAGRFLLRQYGLNGARHLPPAQEEVWQALAGGPAPLARWAKDHSLRRAALRLVKQGQLVLAGFTPSDAAHVLGHQQDWSTDAACLGAELWLRHHQPTAPVSAETITDFCRQVVAQVVRQAGQALVEAALQEAYPVGLEDKTGLGRLLIEKALTADPHDGLFLGVSLTLRQPLVAIGAPVRTYYPALAERLHTRLSIPPHADVANAVGAVVGGIMEILRVLITPLGKKKFRVHLPTGIQDFRDLEEAAAWATDQAGRLVTAQVHRSGAVEVHLQTRRQDRTAPASSGELIFLESEVTVTAIGRPGFQ